MEKGLVGFVSVKFRGRGNFSKKNEYSFLKLSLL